MYTAMALMEQVVRENKQAERDAFLETHSLPLTAQITKRKEEMASADTICLAAIFLASFTIAQETGIFDNLSSEDDEFYHDNFQNQQKQGSDSFHFGDDSLHDPRTNRRVLHSPMAMFSFPKRKHVHLQAKNSKVSSILGSGNFGIIRGGVFADHDDIPTYRNRHRNSNGNSRRTDFFQDFHEFRPSRAQLNNALSNREHWGIV